MCLDTVKRTVVLKKDLKVKKIVHIGRNNNIYTGEILGKRSRIYNGVNRAKIKLIGAFYCKKYESGFHCYLNKYTDCEVLHNWVYFDSRIVVNFIIPKGTEVTYGIQDGLTVIVTPILIYKKEA